VFHCYVIDLFIGVGLAGLQRPVLLHLLVVPEDLLHLVGLAAL
jgi:hypothetical protein